jgi:hypothetical protein
MNDFIAAEKKQPFQMPKTDHLTHPDGIYFNMPEAEYHADPALGSSGIRDLLQSPLTYWIKSPYNPNREEVDTPSTTLGTYVHDELLGKEKTFAVKPKGMSFATKDGKAWRDTLPEETTIITHDMHHAAQMIFEALRLSGIADHFKDGCPEVSFFWTEPNGFRCKIRIDYLRGSDAFELKTYANTMNKDTETAIAHAIAANRYHISGHWYSIGIAKMRAMIQAKGEKAIGHASSDEQVQLVTDQIMKAEGGFPLWFIFMETGGIPNLTVRRFAERDAAGEINAYFRAAKNETDRATSTFARYMESHGPASMWIDQAYSKAFTDEEFTAARWILEEA